MNKMNNYQKPFSLKALDSEFNLVSLITYSSLQWTRKYHEVGQFSVVIDARQYSSDWKYIYTEQRKELGVISQINYQKEEYTSKITLSGYFLESELNKMIVYPLPTQFDDDSGTHYGTSLLKNQGLPTWLGKEGTADIVARDFFNGFKKIAWRNYQVGDFKGNTIVTSTHELDIQFGSIESGDYKYSAHNRNGEYLGNKLYDILNESGASIEVLYNHLTRKKTLNIIHGKDRTAEQTDPTINPMILSTRNGTVTGASIVKSNTAEKDALIQYSSSDELILVLVNEKPDSIGRFMIQNMSANQGDYIKDDTPDKAKADKEHKLAVLSDAVDKLYENRAKLNLDFDTIQGSFRYMIDYDLGDKISVEVPEIDLSVDVQIIACREVVEKGVWKMSFELGTPLKIRKRG